MCSSDLRVILNNYSVLTVVVKTFPQETGNDRQVMMVFSVLVCGVCEVSVRDYPEVMGNLVYPAMV